MNDDDKFFFDLKGFVHLKGVLSQEEVDRCNAAIDAHADRFFQTERTLEGNSKVLGGANKQKWMEGMLEWERPHCEPFRDLLVHAKIQPYLNELLGSGYRLDHGPLLIAMDKGDGGHYLHGGGVERQDFLADLHLQIRTDVLRFDRSRIPASRRRPRRRRPSSHTRIPQSQLLPA